MQHDLVMWFIILSGLIEPGTVRVEWVYARAAALAWLSRYRGCVHSDAPHLNHAALSAAAPRKRHKSESLSAAAIGRAHCPNLRFSMVNGNSRNSRDNRRQLSCNSGELEIVNKAAFCFHGVDKFEVMAVNEFVLNYATRWL